MVLSFQFTLLKHVFGFSFRSNHKSSIKEDNRDGIKWNSQNKTPDGKERN